MGSRAGGGTGEAAAVVPRRRRRVRASGLWWRAVFDGYEVTLVKWWCPVPGRRAYRFRVADVLATSVTSFGGEGELCGFALHLRGGRCVEVGSRVGIRRQGPWYELWAKIDQAVGIRESHILRTTVGLGPWGEEEWARVEALVPEITAFATHAYRTQPDGRDRRVEIGHREGMGTLLSRLAEPRKPPGLTGGYIALAGRDILDSGSKRDDRIRRRGDAWAALLERLQNGTEVTDTPHWAKQVNVILDCG